MFYEKHIFVCTNQKEPGKKCCAQAKPLEMIDYLRSQLQGLNLFGPGKIRVSQSGCLGRCALGPSLVIYPEGIWYKYQTKSDIDCIIKEHIQSAKVVSSLKLND